MPLTTRHSDGRWIDSTDPEHWAEVHVPGYPHLLCPECEWRMVAVDREGVVNYFRHDVGRPDTCSLGRAESQEHLHAKKMTATAIRELNGWTAEIEFPRGGDWRADVLAISPSGHRRIAWEPQFSPISPEKAAERTRRHRESGVETIWLDERGKGNLDDLPQARLYYQEEASTVRAWALDGQRLSPYKLALARFVQAVCLGNLVRSERGYWSSPHDLAELTRRAREAERKRAEEQRLAQARAEFNRKYAAERLEQEARERAEREAQWERERAEREAQESQDAAERKVRWERERAEREREDREHAERVVRERAERERTDRERAEREAREHAEREQAMRSDPVPRPPLRALGDWQADPSVLSDAELANLVHAYARAERPEPAWVETMQRVQDEIRQRATLS